MGKYVKPEFQPTWDPILSSPLVSMSHLTVSREGRTTLILTCVPAVDLSGEGGRGAAGTAGCDGLSAMLAFEFGSSRDGAASGEAKTIS